MKEIIYGTSNPAKVAQVRDVLEPEGFIIQGLGEAGSHIIVEENGVTAEENALKKARAYADELQRSVLSMDVALYFDGLPEDQQPGLHVRRIQQGDRPTDKELLVHYAGLAARTEGKLRGYWHYAFALAWPDGREVSFTHDSPRIFTSTPSETMVEGFPLESLQIDLESGSYISEMDPEMRARFWRATIGEPLVRFMVTNFVN